MTEAVIDKKKLPRSLVMCSAVLAALAFMLPVVYMFLHRQDPGFEQAFIAGLAASALWLALLIYGFGRHRRVAVWLLLGTPLALWWPTALLLLELACRFGDDCL
jgi:hypothetical protein